MNTYAQPAGSAAGNLPILRTARLVLETPKPSDASSIFSIAGDLRATEHNPSDRLREFPEAESLVARWISHWRQHGFGYWCVREYGHSAVAGYCGVKRMTAVGRPVLNLIYRFRPEVWGCGYATEAARTVVEWSTVHVPGATILARVRPGNFTSQKVALKSGLLRDPAMDEQGEDGPDLAFSNRFAANRISDL